MNIHGNFNVLSDWKDASKLLDKNRLQTESKLNLISTNIRSLRKHWDSLTLSLCNTLDSLDVIVLTEINVTQEESNFYNLPGFNSIAKCRPTGRRGGGIMVFTKEELQIKDISLEFYFNSTEFLILQLSYKKEYVILGAFYRPPSQNVNNFNEELEIFLTSNLVTKAKHLIMAGDINICYLTGMYGSEEYLNVLYTNRMLNTIQEPTRVEFYGNNLVATCLDHINIRTVAKEYTAFIVEEKLSDHYWTGLTFSLKSYKLNSSVCNTIENNNVIILDRLVNEGIRGEDWLSIIAIRDTELIYQALIHKFNNIYAMATREVSNRKQSQRVNPWMNNELRALIDHKKYLWTQWKRDRYNIHYMRLFKNARNNLTNRIRIAKQNYYSKIIEENMKNSRKTWDVINSVLNKKKKPSVYENIKNSFSLDSVTEVLNKADDFKDFFKTSVESISNEMTDSKFDISQDFQEGNHDIGLTHSMYFQPINENVLIEAINKLNAQSAPGPDQIRSKDIKNNIVYLLPILLHLMKSIVKNGKIPIDMKKTYLRPIHKSGSKKMLQCYRPIGSISVITKILEYYICEQLKKYLVNNSIINKSQYGFMPKRSTIDLLECLTNEINKSLNENKYVLAVATDLSKAFDLVDYTIMLNKLEKIGIRGPLLELFKDYFKDRKLFVSIGQIVSSGYNQKFGLIQGGILSPILFNIYVNDLASLNLNCKILQYADDNIFFVINKDLNIALNNMQHDLDLVVKYFFNNSIKLNSQKTKAIIFKTPRNTIQNNNVNILCHSHKCFRTINGRDQCSCQNLVFHQTIKHLGILLDSNMKFDSHVTYLKNMLKMVLYKCTKITEYFPVATKRVIYFSLVQSMFVYGISIYYQAPEYKLIHLKKILCRIYEVLFPCIEPRLLGILMFDNLAKYIDLNRNFLNEEYRIVENVDYNLRRRLYIVNRYTNSYGKFTLETRIPMLLNALPEGISNELRVNKFKIKLKNHFLSISNN